MKNIETMMKFCSKISDIFGYPYFFNWSPPTNHRDNKPDGEIEDVSYVIFRVGMYPQPKIEMIDGVEYENGHQSPIEKQLFFGQVIRIIDFTPFNNLLIDISGINRDEYPIKFFDDLEKYKEELKVKISKFLL